MGKTSIEWTDRSINPIRARDPVTNAVGHHCRKVSPGCANCYASRLQARFNMPEYRGEGAGANGAECFLDATKLAEVRARKKPTKYFWCDMTDLFGEWVPDDWIDQCFTAMCLTPQHTHQVLTKRPERMRRYFATYRPILAGRMFAKDMPDGGTLIAPLKNVWLGVSVEDQQRADERIPLLLEAPAAVRFLSCEPLLGPLFLLCDPEGGARHWLNGPLDHPDEPSVDWVIVGGESGPGARPCRTNWIRSVVSQCDGAGVPVFVKQLGARPVDFRAYPYPQDGFDEVGEETPLNLRDPKGGDPDEWPEDLRVREFPR